PQRFRSEEEPVVDLGKRVRRGSRAPGGGVGVLAVTSGDFHQGRNWSSGLGVRERAAVSGRSAGDVDRWPRSSSVGSGAARVAGGSGALLGRPGGRARRWAPQGWADRAGQQRFRRTESFARFGVSAP